jgi:Chaperone of endosialidase
MFTQYSHKAVAILLLLSLAAFSVPQMRAADPGYIPQIAPDGTPINSPFFVNGGQVNAGQLSIDGSTGLITFANGQMFPVNLAGEVTGPSTATVVSNAVSPNTANAIVRRDSTGNFAANTISLSGNLALPNTAVASVGVLTMGGMPFLHNFGASNTFVGAAAGNMTMTGSNNSAFGASALPADTTGAYNAGLGAGALGSNTTGSFNSAFGSAALAANTTAITNSAFGFAALQHNTTGGANSAFGEHALTSNTTAQYNAAFGNDALASNTIGSGNSAFGLLALYSNTTATGNSAFGTGALSANTVGGSNVAVGFDALDRLTVGNSNIAIGYGAGSGFTLGESNNIDIGSTGSSADFGVVRIGTSGIHTAAFIAGVSGTTSPSGVPVFVNSAGQLGTVTSSQRYKEQITDMDVESDVLMKLRPVSFYYKPEYDSTHTRQFGLVAEEVAKIAPNLVVFGEDGQPQTVRYHFVNAMLLNEVQRQKQLIEQQEKQLAEQQQQIDRLNAALESQQAAQQAQFKELMQRLAALEKSAQPETQLASAR